MREGWREVRLGEVLALDLDPVIVRPEAEYELAGVYSFGRGLFRRDPLLGAKTSYKQLHRLRQGQLVLSKLKAWEGAVAVVGAEFEGFVLSPEFPTFSIKGALEPDYLSLLCGQGSFWERLRQESRGVGGRRERVHPRRLLEVAIDLPPLVEQRRIVDLATALDRYLDRLDVVVNRARSAIQPVIDHEASGSTMIPLPEVLALARAGGTPSRKERAFFGGTIPWLKSGEVAQYSISQTEESLTREGLEASAAWVVPEGAVVVAMYGATAGQVGWTAIPLATNQAVLALLVRDDRADARFIFHWLRGKTGAMKDRAMGAAQPNLSKERVLAQAVPDLPVPQQRRIAGLLDSIFEATHSASIAANAGRGLRSVLVADLLAGNHEIPDSYDELLEPAS